MTTPPVAESSTDEPGAFNEAERLSALTALAILDTPAEERFDRVTRLWQRLFGVELAFLNLVGEISSCSMRSRKAARLSLSAGSDTFVAATAATICVPFGR